MGTEEHTYDAGLSTLHDYIFPSSNRAVSHTYLQKSCAVETFIICLAEFFHVETPFLGRWLGRVYDIDQICCRCSFCSGLFSVVVVAVVVFSSLLGGAGEDCGAGVASVFFENLFWGISFCMSGIGVWLLLNLSTIQVEFLLPSLSKFWAQTMKANTTFRKYLESRGENSVYLHGNASQKIVWKKVSNLRSVRGWELRVTTLTSHKLYGKEIRSIERVPIDNQPCERLQNTYEWTKDDGHGWYTNFEPRSNGCVWGSIQDRRGVSVSHQKSKI